MTIKNKEQIKELITQCKIYRYTPEETLAFLEEHGHKISERTLRRIKKEMDSNFSQRFLQIAKHEYTDELFRSLDTHRKIEKEYWKLLSKSTVNEKIRIYDAICKTRDKIEYLINAAPMFEKIKNAIDSKFEEIKKLQQNLA